MSVNVFSILPYYLHKFSKKCFKIAENRALLYRTVLLTYITSVCYKSAFHILKVRFYRRWETMDHILKNCNRLFEDTRMNWLKFFGCIKTMFYCRICVLIVGQDIMYFTRRPESCRKSKKALDNNLAKYSSCAKTKENLAFVQQHETRVCAKHLNIFFRGGCKRYKHFYQKSKVLLFSQIFSFE